MNSYQQFQLERYGNILPEWNNIYEQIDRAKITEPEDFPEAHASDYNYSMIEQII